MRLIEKLNYKRLAARLNGAYKKMFAVDDNKLVIRDIVGFARLGIYDPDSTLPSEELHRLRGRQEMAMHILRHLDMDIIQMIEHQNDAQLQGAYQNTEEENY